MRTAEELNKRISQYRGAECIYTENGYIVWQMSTGENCEILFIEVREPRKGYGKELVRAMCKVIKPFNSVFVFRLASNEVAGHFYRSIGFKETPVDGLYKNLQAVLGVVTYDELCNSL